MIFQEPMTSLNPVLTIGYQIAEALMTHRGMSRKEALDEAVMLLKTVQIPSPEVRVKEYPHQLSGGMRQRVMIAMAISCNPALLIADEPTTALDVTIQAQILDLIQRLREERKMSILFITHDLAIIAENAATVGIMYAGRLVETADAREIFHNPKHPYTVGLLASIPTARGTRLTPIAGSVPRPGEQAQGCRYEGRCPLAVRECGLDEPLFTEVAKGHFVRCIRPGEMPWNS
jgi:oligopeptide/dipeptide ABC transporter ATP-binding protein